MLEPGRICLRQREDVYVVFLWLNTSQPVDILFLEDLLHLEPTHVSKQSAYYSSVDVFPLESFYDVRKNFSMLLKITQRLLNINMLV